MEKIRIFLSLPMSGFTDKEIQENINKMKSIIMLKNPFGKVEIEFVDNTDCPPIDSRDAVTPNLLYLGEAIKKMATCNAAVFHPEYSFARGCNVELDVCKAYGIPAYGIDEFHGFEWVPLHTNYWGMKLYKEAKVDENSDNCESNLLS